MTYSSSGDFYHMPFFISSTENVFSDCSGAMYHIVFYMFYEFLCPVILSLSKGTAKKDDSNSTLLRVNVYYFDTSKNCVLQTMAGLCFVLDDPSFTKGYVLLYLWLKLLFEEEY